MTTSAAVSSGATEYTPGISITVIGEQGVISKDFYTNDANNQGANSFNLDKFKGNDPEMEAYINKERLKKGY